MRQKHKKGLCYALLLLLAGLVATGTAWWEARTLVDHELSSQLDLRVTQAKSSLEGQLSKYTEVLRSYQAQFAAHPELTGAAFARATRSLDLERRLPGIQAVGFSPRTPLTESFPVRYVEPLARNAGAVGFDQGADDTRRAAILRARDRNELAVSDRLRLFVTPGDIEGLVFFLPLYSGTEIPDSQSERERDFSGFVFLAIRVDEMLRTVFGPDLLDDLAITIHHEVFEPSASLHESNLIFDSRSYHLQSSRRDHTPLTSLQRKLALQVGGATWTMKVTAQPQFIKHSQTWLPVITALVGALLSLLVFIFIRTLSYARWKSEHHAHEAERSLRTSEQQLTDIMVSIDEVLWTFDLSSRKISYVSPAVELVYGYPPGAFYRSPRLWLKCVHPEDRKRVMAFIRKLGQDKQAIIHYRIVRHDGAIRWLRYAVRLVKDNAGSIKQVNSVGSDVTDEYMLHESLRRSHRALRAIHDYSEKIAVADNEDALLQGICEVAVKAGYVMAWTGLLQPDGEHFALTNIAGENQRYIESIEGPLANDPKRLSTLASVLRTLRPATANDFTRETHLPWRLAALRNGFRSKAALPLLHNGRILGILNVYASEENAFDQEELGFLESLTQSVAGALQSLRERDQRKAAEAALHLRQHAIEASANAIVITSSTPPNYPIEYVNPAFERMTGYSLEEIKGQSLRILHGDDREQPGLMEIRSIVSDRREGHATVRNYHKDGTLFWSKVHIAPVKDKTGLISHFVAAKYDITETKHYQDKLESQANHDALTGLANRQLLDKRLHDAIASSVADGSTFWVAFLDLDRFKLINDSLGHRAGDQLLRQISTRLQHVLRKGDTLARHGGDEFVLILPADDSTIPSSRIVQLIMDVVTQPLKIDEHLLYMTCSIGIAICPEDGNDPDTLVKHADIAMYRAKEAGRNNVQFFTPGLNENALEQLGLEVDLHRAIERGEFVLHYQPQVSLKTGKLYGMEALIRWQHPELGLVSPGRFIGIAEDTGLIIPIGNWAIRNACLQNQAWQDAGLTPLQVTVNLSARQFGDIDLTQSIRDILDETGLSPEYLNIELTENLAIADVERSITTLCELKQLGLQLSIDDFGTGYSSLSCLTRFPIDVLKIDQSFVRAIDAGVDGAAVIKAIITLAHSLRLRVIAEGVETQDQLRFLQENQCDQIQGYYFSKPLPALEFERMVRDGKTLQLESC